MISRQTKKNATVGYIEYCFAISTNVQCLITSKAPVQYYEKVWNFEHLEHVENLHPN